MSQINQKKGGTFVDREIKKIKAHDQRGRADSQESINSLLEQIKDVQKINVNDFNAQFENK